MKEMEKVSCSQRVFDGRHSHLCSHNGRYEEKGKYYCKYHLPSEIKKRENAREQKWKAQRVARNRSWEIRKSDAEASELLKRVVELFEGKEYGAYISFELMDEIVNWDRRRVKES